MKRLMVLLTILLTQHLHAQDVHLTVLAYQWTTSHNLMTFTWDGHSNTSCKGSADLDVIGNNISGTSSSSCSTTFMPPTTQQIDIQKPVLYMLADTESSRMVLTCTRNVLWSQCHALNPGAFLARNNGGFEVQATFGGKEKWVKYDVVQQTAISRRSEVPAPEAQASIEAPAALANGFPTRWKSLLSGRVNTLRFENDYLYAEVMLPETAAKAGAFILTSAKKEGDKYVGTSNARLVSIRGNACSVRGVMEFTLVTPARIEGRSYAPPMNAVIDWKTCKFSAPEEWASFTWIPVR